LTLHAQQLREELAVKVSIHSNMIQTKAIVKLPPSHVIVHSCTPFSFKKQDYLAVSEYNQTTNQIRFMSLFVDFSATELHTIVASGQERENVFTALRFAEKSESEE